MIQVSKGANKLIVLLLRNAADRTSHRGYNCPKEAVETYNVKIDGRNFFDRPLTNGERTYDSAWKITNGQGDDYTAGCQLDYPYLK